MTEWPPVDPTDAAAVAEKRDELAAAVRDHAGAIAYQIAKLQGGDYGREEFKTSNGTWTVKHEAGDLDFLHYKPKSGSEIYVVSQKSEPDAAELSTALEAYGAFVRAFNDYVAETEATLAGIETELPEAETTEAAVQQRHEVLSRIEEVANRIAGELHRYEGGEYGTFSARIEGERWELNWDRDGVSYLRVGGSDGVYLVSQYAPPSASDLRRYAPTFGAFVEAYNEDVASQERTLEDVEL
jgi:quinol monooxygenase YgiN